MGSLAVRCYIKKYDYEIDKDGHGLKVIPKTGGSILVYFEAGAPVNDSALALIVVDP